MRLTARFAAFALAALWQLTDPAAVAGMASDTPLSEVRTIKDLMADKDQDIHLVLVHGMRTSDRTTWDRFREALCAHLGGQCASATPPARLTDQLILENEAPSAADYMGQKIWGDDAPDQTPRRSGLEKWMGSQPFVDHYRYPLKNGRSLIVDEINYWPLLYAFKCQFIVPQEAKLAGPNSTNIGYCGAGDDTHFAWFSPAEQASLMASRPRGGRAPLVNGWIKNPILDWGISDAVLTLGTLKDYLRDTVRCAFADVAALAPRDFDDLPKAGKMRSFPCEGETLGAGPLPPAGTRFVLMSHSLGAFVLMDTFAAAAGDANYYQSNDNCRVGVAQVARPAAAPPRPSEKTAAAMQRSQSLCFILRNSNDLYFFANQFPLLELARAQGLPDSDGPPHESALVLWAETTTDPSTPKQIVAFSDPGDILTFNVPQIKCDAPGVACVRVVNAYPKNSGRWLGLFENPISAHVNYLHSKDVLDVVFGQ